MPFDSNGVFSLVPGYLAVTGQVIQPSQHNPVLEDLSGTGLSAVYVKDGRAPMTGNMNIGGFQIKNMAAGTLSTDAINLAQFNASFGPSISGFLFGLTLSNNGAIPAAAVDIAGGSAASDSASPVIITASTAISKTLAANWAVGGTPGSPAGGLDTGSTTNATYHVWLIQRSDTGVVDALFSLSATAPTMPTNYDRKRRIGAILRVAGANLPFFQDGDDFWWTLPPQDVSVANLGLTTTNYTLSVPAGIAVTAIISGFVSSSGSGQIVYIHSPGAQAQAPTGRYFTVNTPQASTVSAFGAIVRTSTSGQIQAVSTIVSTTLSVTTMGYIDKRGRVA